MNNCDCRDARALPAPATIATWSEFQRGVAASIPVMIGFVPFALVLGTQAVQKGFRPAEVPLMTGLNFGGGSEFAAVKLWNSPPHLLLIAAITLLVNSRHLLMGAALVPYLRDLPKRQVLPALFLMCDESWALGLADARKRGGPPSPAVFSLPYYFGAALGLYLTWVTFTTAGALAGPSIGDVSAYGFDMAFPAVFLVLLRGMWKSFRAARPWFVSLFCAALAALLAPSGWHVPAGALTGVMAAWIWAGEEARS